MSHHPQEDLLAQFSLYVHKGGLKPDLFHFIFVGSFFNSINMINPTLGLNELCLFGTLSMTPVTYMVSAFS